MLLSFLTWCGYVGIVLGLLGAWKWRGKALKLAGLGVVLVMIGWFWPNYDYSELHSLEVKAPKEQVYAAVKEVTMGEVALFRTLITIRSFGRARGLDTAAKLPLLDVMVRSGFKITSDEPGKGLVVKARPMLGMSTDADMSIEEVSPGTCRVSTRTIVTETSPGAARRFAPYWRTIYPGSWVLRITWLQAIKKRAEAPSPA